MSRIAQPAGTRGSLKWIQRCVNERPSALDPLILAKLDGASQITWRSPRADDDFAEYRDAAFLERIGAERLAGDLAAFWPTGGPQWDALGITDRGDALLIEAKAHIAEMLSPATQASPASRSRIEAALAETVQALGATPKADWCETFFQLANRFAHLHFLRSRGVSAWLVLVNFVGDEDMDGPSTAAEWEAAYQVALHVMGLPARHKLSRYVVHAYTTVAALT